MVNWDQIVQEPWVRTIVGSKIVLDTDGRAEYTRDMIEKRIQRMVEHLEADGPIMAGLVELFTDASDHIKDLEAELENQNFITCPECGKYIA